MQVTRRAASGSRDLGLAGRRRATATAARLLLACWQLGEFDRRLACLCVHILIEMGASLQHGAPGGSGG